LLVYKLPPQPTRLRIQAWRRLQALGAIYLQDGVAALPSRPDLVENLRYIADSMQKGGGTAISLVASSGSDADRLEIEQRFRAAADARMNEILASLDKFALSLDENFNAESVCKLDEALKRERIGYLKVRRLNFFGSELEGLVEARLSELKERIHAFGGTTK